MERRRSRESSFFRVFVALGIVIAASGERLSASVFPSTEVQTKCSEWYAVSRTGEILSNGPRTKVDEIVSTSVIDMTHARRTQNRGAGTLVIFFNSQGEEVTHAQFCKTNL
ncbi:MAG: hypothetical protein Q7S31_00570 [bacterium]|nr:hypothetical protein [bacterium]